eukprot:7729104-Pyramimonas_sp.AAC.1
MAAKKPGICGTCSDNNSRKMERPRKSSKQRTAREGNSCRGPGFLATSSAQTGTASNSRECSEAHGRSKASYYFEHAQRGGER